MLETDFFKKFCSNDNNAAAEALVNFANTIRGLFKLKTNKLITSQNFNTQDEEDVIQDVLINFFIKKRIYICSKNKLEEFGEHGFTQYFIKAVDFEVIDRIRKMKSKTKPFDFTSIEKKEAFWQKDYTTDKEQCLMKTANLTALQLEITKIFCLQKVSDHFKLIVVLNIFLKKNDWHYLEMEKMQLLQHQINYNEKLNNYDVVEIYRMKTANLIKHLGLGNKTIEKYRDKIRTLKFQITRKLQRAKVWKYIHLQI